MGWYAAANKLNGFLRWAWDNRPADPARDARHVRFPAGDTFLVYPGPMSSIRMERLREGFVDFEKLQLVRRLLAANQSSATLKATAKLDKALGSFSRERVKSTDGSTIAQDVRTAQEALDVASRIAFGQKKMTIRQETCPHVGIAASEKTWGESKAVNHTQFPAHYRVLARTNPLG